MALEVERKFLVADDAWKRDIIKSEHMRDGLIARFGDGKVRVRQTESGASLTIKGPRKGTSRPEFEYEIPRADAERGALLAAFTASKRGVALGRAHLWSAQGPCHRCLAGLADPRRPAKVPRAI